MKQNIQIEKPCAENFNKMSDVSVGKFCNSCQTKIIDFTKMSLDEIELFFSKQHTGENICGRYNARHTTTGSAFTVFLNKIENAVYKTRFRKVAVWTISVVFFLLNSYKCMGKRMDPNLNYESKSVKNDSIVKPK